MTGFDDSQNGNSTAGTDRNPLTAPSAITQTLNSLKDAIVKPIRPGLEYSSTLSSKAYEMIKPGLKHLERSSISSRSEEVQSVNTVAKDTVAQVTTDAAQSVKGTIDDLSKGGPHKEEDVFESQHKRGNWGPDL